MHYLALVVLQPDALPCSGGQVRQLLLNMIVERRGCARLEVHSALLNTADTTLRHVLVELGFTGLLDVA